MRRPDGETLELEADHRRHAEVENAIRDLKYGVGLKPHALGALRRQRRLAGGTGDGPQHGPLDGANRPGRAGGGHQDPPAAVLRSGGAAHPLGAPPHTASATALALGSPVQPRPGTAASGSTSSLTATPVSEPSNGQPNIPANSRPPGPRVQPAASDLTITRFPASIDRSRGPVRLLKTLCGVTSVPMEPRLSPL